MVRGKSRRQVEKENIRSIRTYLNIIGDRMAIKNTK